MSFVLLGTERVESLNLHMMPEVADIISSAGKGMKERRRDESKRANERERGR